MYERTKLFALRIIRLCSSLPKTSKVQILSKPLLRSGTSVGAHYREVRRVSSRAEFVSKIEGGTGIRRNDYWRELLSETLLNSKPLRSDLYKEADELLAMLVALEKTAKLNR
ncbi:MAG: four helix bundle protein [Nitrospiraceae bacterium]